MKGYTKIGIKCGILFFMMSYEISSAGVWMDTGHVVKRGITCPTMCVCASVPFRVQVLCTAKNLTELPEGLSPKTTELDLSLNNFTSLPDGAFSDLRRMNILRMETSGLTDLAPNVFAGLTRLVSLFLSGNKLTTFPARATSRLSKLVVIDLYLNQISDIPLESFKNLPNLKNLRLTDNRLTEVPVKALRYARRLTALYMESNLIEEIPDYAFRNSTDIVVLCLSNNKISHIGSKAFEGLAVLEVLHINNNRLKEIPPSINSLPDLAYLKVSENRISYIPDDVFQGNRKLSILSLTDNPIKNIGKYAFRNLPALMELVFSEAKEMTEFPILSGTNKLKDITLDRASITTISEDLCEDAALLEVLDVHSNKISVMPRMTNCSEIHQINFGNNDIISLENLPLKGLKNLKDLILSYNQIKYISDKVFQGLTKLQYLDLSHNGIREIHLDGFSTLTSLKTLNLAENSFPVLPTKGLSNLRSLKTFHNKNLVEPPSKDALPNIVSLALAYAYHCCAFIRKLPEEDTKEGAVFSQEVTWLEYPNGSMIDSMDYNFNMSYPFYPSSYDLYSNMSNNTVYEEGEVVPPHPHLEVIKYQPPVVCRPKPGPFLPCDDLFGWWSLRCGVWIVFLLAVLGNGAVLFVSITSKSKMDVTRFLICNLAFSDLCMGIYLGCLAIVDASTLGAFEKYAVHWQSSRGCLVAGFLGVLSSELSVFTLVIITLERFYAISHAMQLDKRLTLRHTGFAMVGGWLLCLTIASLPLFKISDYRKFAICLPFETENKVSLGYVCFIMIFNAISFLIILVCYFGMFLSVRGSHSWNTNDTVVAKRMALLVFTDFFCWAPIIFFSLTAAFGSNLAIVSLDEAKVLTIFVLPLNSCANPFLYAFFTRQFKRDCVKLCKRIEEAGISRHFSTSGVRRSSSASNRQVQNHPFRIKPGNCENLLREDNDTNGEASNSNSDSDYNVKHVQLTEEEEKILHYVRSDSGIYVDGAKSQQMSDESPEAEQKQTLFKATNMLWPPSSPESPEKAVFSLGKHAQRSPVEEEEQDSGADIVLHTNQGQIYLNTKHQTSKKPILRNRHKLKEVSDRCGEKLSRYYKRPPPEQIILTRPVKNSRKADSQYRTIGKRDIECSKNETQTKVKSKIARQKMITEKFAADRSLDLGLKVNYYKHKQYKMENPHKEIIFVKGRNIATQTETNVQLRKGNRYGISKDLEKSERDRKINEWRKTSHLSFLWRNSGSFDAVTQKQKSNSLVELTRPVYDWNDVSNKRHSSLTSRHEGYILLKNGSRDSAYEDEDLYEFRDGRQTYIPQSKSKNCGVTKWCTTIPENSHNTKACSRRDFSIDSDEICETSVLLPVCQTADSSKIPKDKNSYDDESGISSSS